MKSGGIVRIKEREWRWTRTQPASPELPDTLDQIHTLYRKKIFLCWRGGDRYQKWLVPADLLLTRWRRVRVLRLWTGNMNKAMQPHLSPGHWHTLLLQTCCCFLNFSSWRVTTFRTQMKVGTALKHLQHFPVRKSLPAVCSPSWRRDVTTYNVVGYKKLDLDWLWSGSFMSC